MTRIDTTVRRIAILTIVAGTVMIALRDSTSAQRGPAEPTPPPRWLPYYNNGIGDVTAAERAAATRVLKELERILLQVPELASPKGFEIMPQHWGGSRMLGPGEVEVPNSVVEYMLRLYFFAPTQAIAGEGPVCISIMVNSKIGSTDLSDSQGRWMYYETERGDPMPLATQVFSQLMQREEDAPPGYNNSWVRVVMTSGGEPHSKTVTREEYYNAVLRSFEGKNGANLAIARKAAEKTPYQDWMEGAERRRKDREETLRIVAASQAPAAVANMRKILEDTEREVTQNLKAAEAEHLETGKEALAAAVTSGEAIRAELRSMTAAQRSMPALIDPTRGDGFNATTKTMADRDSLAMWRVLTPNFDFWRARKSPVEVRSITVYIGGGTGNEQKDREAVHNALWQTSKKLDWAALNRLLDVPR